MKYRRQASGAFSSGDRSCPSWRTRNSTEPRQFLPDIRHVEGDRLFYETITRILAYRRYRMM